MLSFVFRGHERFWRLPSSRAAYEALPAIYDVSLKDNTWLPMLDSIVAATDAKAAAIFGTNETDFEYSLERASSFWIDKPFVIEEFRERYGHYDDFGRDKLFSTPPHSPITDHDIWPGVDLRARDDFRYFREKFDIFLRSGMNLSPAHGWKAGLIVHFPNALDAVGAGAREVLSFLGPHLTRSLELKRFVSQLAARYRLVLSVLDKVRVGLCVADERGELVIVNAEARAIFDRGGGLGLDRSNRIVCRDPDIGRRLGAAMAQVARTARRIDRNGGVTLHVERPDGGEPYYSRCRRSGTAGVSSRPASPEPS